MIGLPFIFRDYDHVREVLDGPVGEALAAEMETAGAVTKGIAIA